MSDNIIQLNEDLIKHDLKDFVRSSVEETLNALLDTITLPGVAKAAKAIGLNEVKDSVLRHWPVTKAYSRRAAPPARRAVLIFQNKIRCEFRAKFLGIVCERCHKKEKKLV